MNEFIADMKSKLDTAGEVTQLALNAVSLVFIVAGAVYSFISSIQERSRLPGRHPRHIYFRRVFGGWLIVALEFQLAADIVGTIISPTTGNLVELGAIALVRTFLNYFLNKELNEETQWPNAAIEKKINTEK